MGIVWCIIGTLVLLYCGGVWFMAGKMRFVRVPAAGSLMGLILGVLLLLFPGNGLLHGISFLGICGILVLLLLEGSILFQVRRLPVDTGPVDYTVVLGCGLRDGERASRTMVERLQKALEVWQGEKIVLSGGQSGREKYPEAEVMAQWLMNKGVPREKLILEDHSRNTLENLHFSRKKKKKDSGLPVKKLAVRLVTNDFHAPRALSIARQAGVDAYGVPAKTGGIAAPLYHLRECLAVPLWWGRKWKMRKGERRKSA